MKTRHKIITGDALNLESIPNDSVDLIVTSPPYFGQRMYFDDNGNPITEAVGSEATPEEYLNALDAFMEEAWRVIKPSGSVFVNLGDKYAGSGGHNNASIQGKEYDAETMTRDGPTRYVKIESVRRKSLLGLPWRFATRQIDNGWVLRAEIIWDKPNGMPESVTDRVRRTHEQWFHLTKSERYFAAVDELRQPHKEVSEKRSKRGRSEESREGRHPPNQTEQGWNPSESIHKLGKLPSSVQSISTGGVRPTKTERATFNLPDHFAPFPPEWPRFFILGWSPKAWCGECGEAVIPSIEKQKMEWEPSENRQKAIDSGALGDGRTTLRGNMKAPPTTTITGYECGCSSLDPSSWTPATVLDPFAGTGTTSLVASILDRNSIAVDISPAYTRLIKWRLFISDHKTKLIKKWEKKGLL